MTDHLARALLIALGCALLAAIGVLVFRGGEKTDFSLQTGEPAIASPNDLSEVAADLGAPVYWVGERDGAEYEVTKTRAGRIYIRYLEGGAGAGDPRADFLTVGTYPSKNGAREIRQSVSAIKGARLGRTDDGAVLLIDPSSATSAHLAYPGAEAQIEVYSPVHGEALRLAKSGDAQPVP
jgi:hypothetical protein